MRVNLRLALTSLVLLAAVFLSGQKYLTCQVFYRSDKQVRAGQTIINVQTARTAAELGLGLSGRACIAPTRGMLFEFNQPGNYPFWMKGMRFSIDIIWIDSNKKVVYVKPYISPDTYPRTFVNDKPAQYVLELAAGRAGQLNISPGSKLSF